MMVHVLALFGILGLNREAFGTSRRGENQCNEEVVGQGDGVFLAPSVSRVARGKRLGSSPDSTSTATILSPSIGNEPRLNGPLPWKQNGRVPVSDTWYVAR